MRHALKVGVSGVRGVVGESLTPQAALTFAQAFGTYAGHGSIVVGRDTRPTGPMIEQAVVAGLLSVGCKPILAGVVPTPSVLMLTQHLGALGGMVITASHNPVEWNALKFIHRQGVFLNQARAEELFDTYHQEEFPFVAESELPTVGYEPHPVDPHFARIAAYVDVAAIRKRRFKVAMDCCNGVGAIYSIPFLTDVLGCEVVPIHDEPTGLFEREPEPLPEHLGVLCQQVVDQKCDLGFAQDPDGDRLVMVNERGEAMAEDLTVALAVEQVLSAHEKGPVVVNLATSQVVEAVARKYDCPLVRTRIGEIHVSETMGVLKAPVGGEHNGGVIVPAIHPCRDSFTGMAIILELLAHRGKTLSEIRDQWPRYQTVRKKIAVRSEQVPGLLRAVRHHYQDEEISLLDGIHVTLGESRIHVRLSNTEPVIRLMAEAATEAEAHQLAETLEKVVTGVLSSG